MQTSVEVQLQGGKKAEETAPTVKRKAPGYPVFKLLVAFILLAVAIGVVGLYGERIVTLLTTDAVYTSNDVEVIQQETQRISVAVREQRESIYSLETRFSDQRNANEQRFTELEQKVEKLESELAQVQKQTEVKTHKVLRGETMWSISMKHYGSGIYVNQLATYNKIPNPRHIVTGTTIQVPPVNALK